MTTTSTDEIQHIGILGGSFDPVHKAHIALALAAVRYLNLNCVHLLPAAQPWQRQGLRASPQQRLDMLRLACQDYPKLHVNDLEVLRPGPTYSIDTLLQLPRNATYTWVMGTDQLLNFCTWHRWREIADLVQLAVAQRPGSTMAIPDKLQSQLATTNKLKQIKQIPFCPMDISASQIRTLLAAGKDVSEFLDNKVLNYIRLNQLYGVNN